MTLSSGWPAREALLAAAAAATLVALIGIRLLAVTTIATAALEPGSETEAT